ncbi:porin [Solemya elarraichensis gill symbiont]|uniref:porin n=1 Tax=Solemya elarraichensis gill symbiont TaxID=1918949 RepID=UPI00351F8D29
MGAAYDFGNNRIKVAYGENDSDRDNRSPGESEHWAIGLDHKLSKRTKAYAVYANADGENDRQGPETQDLSGFSLGLMHSF